MTCDAHPSPSQERSLRQHLNKALSVARALPEDALNDSSHARLPPVTSQVRTVFPQCFSLNDSSHARLPPVTSQGSRSPFTGEANSRSEPFSRSVSHGWRRSWPVDGTQRCAQYCQQVGGIFCMGFKVLMFKLRQPAYTACSNPRSYHATFLTSKDMERPAGGSAAARCCCCCYCCCCYCCCPPHHLPPPLPSPLFQPPSDPTHLLAAAVQLRQEAERARSTRGT